MPAERSNCTMRSLARMICFLTYRRWVAAVNFNKYLPCKMKKKKKLRDNN